MTRHISGGEPAELAAALVAEPRPEYPPGVPVAKRPASRPFTVTTTTRFKTGRGELERLTWPQLVTQLRAIRTIEVPADASEEDLDAAKKTGPCLIGGKSITGGVDGTAFKSRCLVALDLDGELGPEAIDRVRALGCNAALYETFRSAADKRRWRLLVPLVKPLPVAVYADLVDALTDALGIPQLTDATCRQYSRRMALPARPSTDLHDRLSLFVTDRDYLDGTALLDRWRSRPAAEAERPEPVSDTPVTAPEPDSDAQLTPEVIALVERMRAATEGERNTQLSRAAYTIYVRGLDRVEHAAIPLLRDAAIEAGLPPTEVDATIESARKRGRAELQTRIDAAFSVITDEELARWDAERREAEQIAARDRAIKERVQVLIIEREARRQIAEADRKPLDFADSGTLDMLLALPPQPKCRVRDLLPTGGTLQITGQAKIGKSTLALDLSRCLLTGDPFLGAFEVVPVEHGKVGYLNAELAPRMIGEWAGDIFRGAPAEARSRMQFYCMRGHGNPLGSDADRAEFSRRLRADGVKVAIIDPFGAVFDGEDQNNAGSVRRWFTRLEECMADAGVEEIVILSHAGWDGGRVRGTTAQNDWPDVNAVITRDKEGRRFLTTSGRADHDIDGMQLFLDENRRLTVGDGLTRKRVAAADAVAGLREPIMMIIEGQPGINVSGVRQQLSAMKVSVSEARHVGDTLNALVAENLVVRSDGPHNSKRFHMAGLIEPEDGENDPAETPENDPADASCARTTGA